MTPSWSSPQTDRPEDRGATRSVERVRRTRAHRPDGILDVNHVIDGEVVRTFVMAPATVDPHPTWRIGRMEDAPTGLIGLDDEDLTISRTAAEVVVDGSWLQIYLKSTIHDVFVLGVEDPDVPVPVGARRPTNLLPGDRILIEGRHRHELELRPEGVPRYLAGAPWGPDTDAHGALPEDGRTLRRHAPDPAPVRGRVRASVPAPAGAILPPAGFEGRRRRAVLNRNQRPLVAALARHRLLPGDPAAPLPTSAELVDLLSLADDHEPDPGEPVEDHLARLASNIDARLTRAMATVEKHLGVPITTRRELVEVAVAHRLVSVDDLREDPDLWRKLGQGEDGDG